jgi:hypothetical protein
VTAGLPARGPFGRRRRRAVAGAGHQQQDGAARLINAEICNAAGGRARG